MELSSINTTKQVADYLQVSETTIARLVKSGKLKKIKLLGKIRITKEAVFEMINQ